MFKRRFVSSIVRVCGMTPLLWMLAALPAPAHADQSAMMQYTWQLGTSWGSGSLPSASFSSGWLPLASWSSGPITQSVPDGGSGDVIAALAQASITDSAFHMFLTAEAANFSNYPFRYDATAYMDLEIQDYIKFPADTLPAGTPIQARFTATLHDTVSPCVLPTGPNPQGQTSADASARLALSGSLPLTYITDSSCTPLGQDDAARIYSFIINSTAGSTVPVFMELTGSAGASAGQDHFNQQLNFGLHNFADLDAGHTVTFTLDVLTPGATFTTASGFTYQPEAGAVPEPATLLLVAPAFLAAWLKRKGHSGK